MSSSDHQTLEHLFRSSPGSEPGDADAPATFTAREGLARLCVDESLNRRDYKRLLRGGPIAVVVIVPSAAWIVPVRSELRSRTDFNYEASQPKKRNQLLDAEESRICADALSGGGRVLGVSNAPVTGLPPVLVANADLTITVRPPSDRALRRLIRWVTGQPVRHLPPGAATGLDLDVLCGAIREGSTSAGCVRRIAAAIRAGSVVDTTLADVPHVRDLHGYGPAGIWARKLVDDIDAWRAAGSDPVAFAQIDRNVVISGPPGTGKTTLARSIAKSTGLPLIATSIGQLFASTSGYMDAIIKGFDDAVSRTVACNGIILLDELDSLPSRTSLSDSRNKDYWGPLIGQVLTTLDGAVSGAAGRIIVIGCTNYGEALDPALIRPGRLRPITIGLPTVVDLAGIFRQHLGDDLAGVDLSMVARLAAGSTGARVADHIGRVRRAAADAGRPMILADLMTLVAPGDDRPNEMVLVAARHESAHAVALSVTGAGNVRSVSILPEDNAGGRTDWVDTGGGIPTRADIERLVITGLAGRAADELFGSANAGAGGAAESDLGVATRMMASLHGSLGLGDRLVMRAPSSAITEVLRYDPGFARTVDEHLAKLLDQARDFVRCHRDLIMGVADALVEARVLDGDDLRRLIATAPPPTPPPRLTGGRHAH